MYALVMVIHIFVSIVLILVILMQAGRGGGMSDVFGSSSNQTIFGTSAGDFLTKATAVCAGVFIITSLTLAVMSSKRSRSLIGPSEPVPMVPSDFGAGEPDTRMDEGAEGVDMPVSQEAGAAGGESGEISGEGLDASDESDTVRPAAE